MIEMDTTICVLAFKTILKIYYKFFYIYLVINKVKIFKIKKTI